MAGPAGRLAGCGLSRSGATTTSAFASSPLGHEAIRLRVRRTPWEEGYMLLTTLSDRRLHLTAILCDTKLS